MPYYTRKGTSKKDKGKTCVYKKEDNTKVGCTVGPVEKYLAALHINESKENNDLSWIGDIGNDIEGFIEKLSSLIKQHVPVAELEVDWDETSGGGEYFGKVWLYNTFYELYKYGKTFTVRFYRLDPETDEYYQFDSYEDLSQTRLLTILLNDMINVNKKNLSESEKSDIEWLKGPVQIKFADIKENIRDYVSIGDTIYLTGNLYLEEGNRARSLILNNEPVIVKHLHKRPKMDVSFGKHITSLPYWSDNMSSDYVDLGGFQDDDDILITFPEKNNINESEEFDWIQKQEPEKELKKSKRYVIDVSQLIPAPMRYSHDTSLTKQDILRKLEDLGYDVEHIDVDDAKYFYVEPTEGEPSWQYNEYGTPIQYDYWVDYNTDLMDDPTYGGKYQMINLDEFMFLIDNNLIGESEENDLGWMKTTIPTRKNKIDFNKERFETTLDYGNDVNVGDKFIPPGGNIIWTVERKQTTTRGGSYLVTLKSEKNKLKFYNWNPDYGFPSYYRPWKKIIGLKESITESAGISFEVRDWSNLVYNEIMSNLQEKNRLIIDGYDHPEVFDRFPIDYVVVDFHDKITGYDHVRSGYDKDGNYVVILFIQPQLIQGIRGYDLKSGLNHEFKHAYEDYQRRSKGKTNIDQTKESKDFYTQDFIKLLNNTQVVGPIKDILKYYYYVSNIEKSAFLENVYDNNPEYETTIRDILAKDFETFKNRYDLELNWHLVNVAYNIPIIKKFKSARDFIDHSATFLRKKALKILKKINKMKYIHGKM